MDALLIRTMPCWFQVGDYTEQCSPLKLLAGGDFNVLQNNDVRRMCLSNLLKIGFIKQACHACKIQPSNGRLRPLYPKVPEIYNYSKPTSFGLSGASSMPAATGMPFNCMMYDLSLSGFVLPEGANHTQAQNQHRGACQRDY